MPLASIISVLNFTSILGLERTLSAIDFAQVNSGSLEKTESAPTEHSNDETIIMPAVSDGKRSNSEHHSTPLMDKTIVLDAVTDELRNRANSVEDTIAMGESVEALEADEAEHIEATQMIGGVDEIKTAEGLKRHMKINVLNWQSRHLFMPSACCMEIHNIMWNPLQEMH